MEEFNSKILDEECSKEEPEEEQPWHEHKFENIIINPTCTEKGYTIHKCSICGYEYKDNFTIGKHKFENTIIKPTCIEEGRRERVCKLCGYKDVDILPARGHNFTDWIEQTHPTCNEFGTYVRKCEVCGKLETKTTPKLEHKYTEWVIEGDYKTRYCANCGKDEKVNVKKEEKTRRKVEERKNLTKDLIKIFGYLSPIFGIFLLIAGLGSCNDNLGLGFFLTLLGIGVSILGIGIASSD